MAKKSVPKKPPCPTCNGAGGWWAVSNGKGFGKRKWVTCHTCHGSKHA